MLGRLILVWGLIQCSKKAEETSFPSTYPALCKESIATDTMYTDVVESCQVEGNPSFPKKTYEGGHGAYLYQIFLCKSPMVTDKDLKQITCSRERIAEVNKRLNKPENYPAVCYEEIAMTTDCRVVSSSGPYDYSTDPYRVRCHVEGNDAFPEKIYYCGKGVLQYQTFLCTNPEVTHADLRNIKCLEVPATYPAICTNLPSMTKECAIGSDMAPLKEICRVEGMMEFPEKTYMCGKGALQHQAFLCSFFNLTESDLENITCTTEGAK